MTNAVATNGKTEQKEKNLVRHEMTPLTGLQQEMNRLFEDFTSGFSFGQPSKWFEPTTIHHAKVDMRDTETEIIVTAELPGVDMKDVDVSLNANGLAIKGEKQMEKEEKEKGYYRKERSFGSFYRLLPLPCEVENDSVTASYKDGVLKVTLPKTKEAVKNAKKIAIKAG